MLKYMNDNKEIYSMMNYNQDRSCDYQAMINYVNENGLNIFGFAVVADKDTILSINSNPNVSYVYTTPVA